MSNVTETENLLNLSKFAEHTKSGKYLLAYGTMGITLLADSTQYDFDIVELLCEDLLKQPHITEDNITVVLVK